MSNKVLFQKKVEVAEVPKKSLKIELLDRHEPKYTFEGEWVGRDIMLVARTITRAYRKEQRAKRRDLNPTELSEPVTTPTTEVTNA